MRAGGFAQTLHTAHRHGACTALDIGPALGDLVTVPELSQLFPDLDFLIANQHELAVLTGQPNWEAAASLLLDAGARCVVIKRGASGASLRSRTDWMDSPGFSVETTISIGAGDTFNIGFLYGVRQGWALPAALRFGNAVAAMVVSSGRGVLGAPTLVQVNRFLAAR
jgi:sugar/nucleoside kinase (ribokinase family)